MKNFFSIVVIFAVLLVGGVWVFNKQQTEKDKKAVVESLANARRTFAQKARSAANESDDNAYVRSIRGAIESYKDELKKVYAKHPDWRDPKAYEKRVEDEFKKGEKNEAQRKSMLEAYELVTKAHEVLMAANWRPVLTGKGNGDTRLDLYRLEKVRTPEGQSVLQFPFFFWGIEDSTYVSWGNLDMRIWKTEPGKVKNEAGRMVDGEVEKVLGKAEGDAQPHVILQAPGKYVDEFPSFLSIGFAWFPPLPREAKFVDITYTYRTRVAGGGEVESVLKWEKLPVDSNWMVDAGESWEAEEIEATDEEIAGKDEKEEEKKEEE